MNNDIPEFVPGGFDPHHLVSTQLAERHLCLVAICALHLEDINDALS